jgi:hypothetical protein
MASEREPNLAPAHILVIAARKSVGSGMVATTRSPLD